jgi:HD-GYP domain-containing protein (c-di-GMP phosphodiesterase class II)
MSEYEYTLQYPVYTLDNIQLFPAGSILSGGELDEPGNLKEGPQTRTVRLFEYGSIKKDILDFLSQPPYDIIFSDREQVASMLEVMAMSELKFPILECLDYFRGEDFYTYRHMLLVFALSIHLGQELLKEDLDLMNGAFSSPAHDFGKICVPLDVLKKSDPLTRTEKQVLEHHTLAGYILLKYYHDSDLSARIARDHHERNNGSGYPGGITLKDRLVEIVVVSDIYDALISPRPYRPISYDNRTAIEEICGKAGRGEIGWDAVKALVACNRKNKPHYTILYVIYLQRKGELHRLTMSMVSLPQNKIRTRC